MSSPKPETDLFKDFSFEQIAEELDSFEYRMNGRRTGYDTVEGYSRLMAIGELAVPLILEYVDNEEVRSWWSIQALIRISHKISKPADLTIEQMGCYAASRDALMEWGRANGFAINK